MKFNKGDDGIMTVNQDDYNRRMRDIRQGVPLPPKVKQTELEFKPERPGIVFWDDIARCR